MMKFCLDNSRPTKLFRCPNCQKKSLKRYIETETGECLAPEIGRCNREIKCGYHLKPQQNGVLQNSTFTPQKMQPIQPSTLSYNLLQQSMKTYENNYFVRYLHQLFDAQTVEKLITTYRIGTSKYWQGATVFWQLDACHQVRAGKIMLYNPENGKRVKQPRNLIQWVHRVLGYENFELAQCFFGSHLLTANRSQPVAIVESEKTAIIASGLVPDCIWLATGGISQLQPQKWADLQQRNIILYPDLGGFEKWQERAKHLQKTMKLRLIVSDLLEKNATNEDRKNGFDIADFLQRDTLVS